MPRKSGLGSGLSGLSGLSGIAGSAPAWAPTDITGLVFWLKSDAGLYQDAAKTTPATADTNPVGAWADQSGNGNDATQTDGASRPTLKLNIVSGKPVVRGDGVAKFLTTAGALAANVTNCTMVAVAKSNDVAETQRCFYQLGDNASFGLTNSTAGLNKGALRGGAAWMESTVPPDTNWTIYVLRTTANVITYYLNGGPDVPLTGEAAGGAPGATRLLSHATGFFSNSDLAEVFFWNVSVLDANLNLLGAYLNTQYGITWTNL